MNEQAQAAATESTAPAAKPKPKRKAVASSPKAKVKAKKVVKKTEAKAPRGEGKNFIAPEEKDRIRKLIRQKVRRPMTTGEVGELLGVPGWHVRKSARTLVAEGLYTMNREGDGGMLTLAPVKSKK